MNRRAGLLVLVVSTISVCARLTAAQDPLPSSNNTAPKKAITAFVERVTKEGSADFVPVPERIAVFDNDGTRSGLRILFPFNSSLLSIK